MAWQARLGEFRWGAFWSLGTGESLYGSLRLGLVRQGRCGFVWHLRIGTFSLGRLR